MTNPADTPHPRKAPGYYPDVANPAIERYWDGIQWTPDTRVPESRPATGGQRRRFEIGAAVGTLVIVAGVATFLLITNKSGGKSHQAASSSSPSASVSIAYPSTFAPSTPAGPTGLGVGDPLDVTSTDATTNTTSSAATVTVTKAFTARSDASDGSNPQNARFLIFRIKVTGTTGATTFNPNDFYVTSSTGSHYQDGTFSSSWGSPLSNVTVHAGEAASGTIVYDVPRSAATGKIYYSPNQDGNPIGYWTYRA